MTKNEKRCEDCPNRKVKNSIWICEECFDQKCNDIDECPLGYTYEDIAELEEKAKENRLNIGASAVGKERKPRAKKIDDDKVFLINLILNGISRAESEKIINLQATNLTKIIEFDYLGEHYKLDLIKQRKKG